MVMENDTTPYLPVKKDNKSAVVSEGDYHKYHCPSLIRDECTTAWRMCFLDKGSLSAVVFSTLLN